MRETRLLRRNPSGRACAGSPPRLDSLIGPSPNDARPSQAGATRAGAVAPALGGLEAPGPRNAAGRRRRSFGPVPCAFRSGRGPPNSLRSLCSLRSDMLRPFFRPALQCSAAATAGCGHGTFRAFSPTCTPTIGGRPSASMAPSIAAANGGFRFRMSERPKGASSEPAVRCEKRRGPGAFCRAPSRHERFCLLLPHQK